MDEREYVLRERVGRTVILTLNRPEKANAVIPEMAFQMDRYLTEAENDVSVGAVIITAAGSRVFCAGMDLKFLAEYPERSMEPMLPGKGWLGITSRQSPKPLICAVNGTAVGGGFEIALACDLIVAAENAKFGLPEVKRGIMAGAGGVVRLARQIPRAYAMELTLTGDTISAAKAREFGIVNRVVPYEQLMEEALKLAEAISVNAPLSIAGTKKVLLRSMDLGFEDALAYCEAVNATVLASEDAKEGPLAFAEKRAPVWKGR